MPTQRFMKAAWILVFIFILSPFQGTWASAEEIRGESCFTATPSESLETAKEISFALAVREALTRSEAYQSLTRQIKACPLKKSILESAAGCALEDVRVVRAEMVGKRACTEISASLDEGVLQQIVRRKSASWKRRQPPGFQGLLSNESVRILNYKKEGGFVSILYQAKEHLEMESVDLSLACYDGNGTLIRKVSGTFPLRPLMAGETRWGSLPLAPGTVTFDLLLPDAGE